MAEVTVGDVLVAMDELCGYLRTALHDRKPEVELVSLAVTVLGRSLMNEERTATIRLDSRGGAIGIKLGCAPKG
jgi:hypothetical protein